MWLAPCPQHVREPFTKSQCYGQSQETVVFTGRTVPGASLFSGAGHPGRCPSPEGGASPQEAGVDFLRHGEEKKTVYPSCSSCLLPPECPAGIHRFIPKSPFFNVSGYNRSGRLLGFLNPCVSFVTFISEGCCHQTEEFWIGSAPLMPRSLSCPHFWLRHQTPHALLPGGPSVSSSPVVPGGLMPTCPRAVYPGVTLCVAFAGSLASVSVTSFTQSGEVLDRASLLIFCFWSLLS